MTALLHPFLVSLGVVGTAEFGDKTQLLALILASRFRRPAPVIAGIFLATLANHLIAAGIGLWLGGLLQGAVLRWLLGVSFLAAAAWVLIPDKLDEPAAGARSIAAHGALAETFVAFFIAEIGDKTEIATVALAARFEMLIPVVAGTTLGMMAANVPAVLLGHSAARRIPVKPVRFFAAAIFVVLGLRALF